MKSHATSKPIKYPKFGSIIKNEGETNLIIIAVFFFIEYEQSQQNESIYFFRFVFSTELGLTNTHFQFDTSKSLSFFFPSQIRFKFIMKTAN